MPSRRGGVAARLSRRADRLAGRSEGIGRSSIWSPVIDRAVAARAAVCCRMARCRRGRMREVHYDVAIDFQGLMKSAVLARASGAPRVIGFSIWHLREKSGASVLFGNPSRDSPDRTRPDHVDPQEPGTAAQRSASRTSTIRFPLAEVAVGCARGGAHDARRATPFALINPGAAWPNKRWPPERFGEVAAFLRDVRVCRRSCCGDPARKASRSGRRALRRRRRVAPATTHHRSPRAIACGIADGLRAIPDRFTSQPPSARPTVSLFGPTDPASQRAVGADDVAVSQICGSCGCHYERRCHKAAWCLEIDCTSPK